METIWRDANISNESKISALAEIHRVGLPVAASALAGVLDNSSLQYAHRYAWAVRLLQS